MTRRMYINQEAESEDMDWGKMFAKHKTNLENFINHLLGTFPQLLR